MKTIATNKKAFFDYFIIQKLESGIVLNGSEVKSARFSRVSIKDSFVKIIKNEAFLFNAHISYMNTTNVYFKSDENRVKKLLLHKKEINKLLSFATQKGYTIVPLNLYFNNKNILKVQIAVVSGKKLHDKREALKKKALEREAQIELKKWK
ncbi:SsrA-binding protein [Helicobacter sp. MIT 14-3879]|uniref:SsrA-binding protein n=1 Tax=Helicobacter sp. MIT 14-3879 TaxID=2040649 RepID=UPI000E1E5DD4|nr:SsrA-binding protein [Helicobacter sp. MIT 14-3879]RDU63534.1 SsrA-binding protein [Helicobacter sp. MIT 14-3879]